jgi:hypothetical protein
MQDTKAMRASPVLHPKAADLAIKLSGRPAVDPGAQLKDFFPSSDRPDDNAPAA